MDNATNDTHTAAVKDPYLWLEAVDDEKVLDWVREQNKKTQHAFASDDTFKQLQQDLLDVYNAKDRIPWVSKRGNYYYNFWRDAQHPQGLWRRTNFASYQSAQPEWETVMDIDALGKAEGVNWVWRGAEYLPPDYKRCLIDLSRGGADATVSREFDLENKQFVDGGFERPAAKGSVSWIDADTVYV